MKVNLSTEFPWNHCRKWGCVFALWYPVSLISLWTPECHHPNILGHLLLAKNSHFCMWSTWKTAHPTGETNVQPGSITEVCNLYIGTFQILYLLLKFKSIYATVINYKIHMTVAPYRPVCEDPWQDDLLAPSFKRMILFPNPSDLGWSCKLRGQKMAAKMTLCVFRSCVERGLATSASTPLKQCPETMKGREPS